MAGESMDLSAVNFAPHTQRVRGPGKSRGRKFASVLGFFCHACRANSKVPPSAPRANTFTLVPARFSKSTGEGGEKSCVFASSGVGGAGQHGLRSCEVWIISWKIVSDRAQKRSRRRDFSQRISGRAGSRLTMQLSNELFDKVLHNDEVMRNLIVQHNVAYEQFKADKSVDRQTVLKKFEERIREIGREQKRLFSVIRKAVASANLPESIPLDIRDPEFRNRLINNNNNNLAKENSENVEPIPQVPLKCSIMSNREIKIEFECKNETIKTEYPLKCESEIVSLKPDIKEEIKVEDIKKENRDAPSPVESERSSSVETISTDSNNGSECEERTMKIKTKADFLKVTDEKRHFMEMCGLITHLKNASLQKTLCKRNTKSTKRDDYVYEKHKRSRTNGSDPKDGDCKRTRINNNIHLENGCSVPAGATVERMEDGVTCNMCRHPGVLLVCESCLSKYHVSCHTVPSPPARKCPKCLETEIKTEYAAAANSTGSFEQTREDSEVCEATAGLHPVDAGHERALLAGALGQLPPSTLLIPITKSDDTAKPWKNFKPEFRARKSDCAAQSYLLVPGGAAVTVRFNQPVSKSAPRLVQYVDLGDDDDDAKNNQGVRNGSSRPRTTSNVGTSDKRPVQRRGSAELDNKPEPRQPDGQSQTPSTDDRKCDDSLLYAMLAGNKSGNSYAFGSRAPQGSAAGSRAVHTEPTEHVKLEEAHLPAPSRTTLESNAADSDTSTGNSETISTTSSTQEVDDLYDEEEEEMDDAVVESEMSFVDENVKHIEEDREESASAFELQDLEFLTNMQRAKKQTKIRVDEFDEFARRVACDDVVGNEELQNSVSHDYQNKTKDDKQENVCADKPDS